MSSSMEPCGHEPPQGAAQLHGVCVFCYRDRLAAESRARAEAEAREAAYRAEFAWLEAALGTWREWADSSVRAQLRRLLLARIDDVALALVELERAARETAAAMSGAAPSIGELRAALANLDRARGDR